MLVNSYVTRLTKIGHVGTNYSLSHNISYLSDIVIGCKSHGDDLYLSAEIFPPSFVVIRKGRCEGDGGVFLPLMITYQQLNHLNWILMQK